MDDLADKKENVITYETFRKFQKQERDGENLQKLPEDFFQSCAEWISRKGNMYQETKDPMVIKEIENVMTIIKDILDRRERKLLLMAMHAVRSDMVPQNIHTHEEKHYDSIVEHLKAMRGRILGVIKGEEKPEDKLKESVEELEKEFKKEVKKEEKKSIKKLVKKSKPEKKTPVEEKKPESVEELPPEPKKQVSEERDENLVEKPPEILPQENLPKTRHEKIFDTPREHETLKEIIEEEKEEPVEEPMEEQVSPEPAISETEEKTEEPKSEEPLPKVKEPDGYKLVKIMEEIPQFVGTDGNTYGPFKKNDIVTLEQRVADVIISKGKAEFAT